MHKQFCGFKVNFVLNGKYYMFYGKDINRKTTDGGNNPILYAPCYRVSESGEILAKGVINLRENWTIKSLFVE